MDPALERFLANAEQPSPTVRPGSGTVPARSVPSIRAHGWTGKWLSAGWSAGV
ncbi:MAG: hypothetical protein NTU53_23880 [Planctomycetota bacterium]|nr:hypothetical protein [Planctomycetota bacterium]